ncbi:MAG: acyl-CoA dehydrogenase family protein [Chloroflexota bacterium]|nr:acyl-CoA dehydrogenase family protein [Chloroflexota bacterium]
MDFGFNEQQELFRQAIRDFARREVEPIARQCDERQEYPLPLFPKMGELGYLGVKFSPQYGGSQAGLVSGAIMAEELSYASPGIFLGVYVHVYLALSALAAFGSEAQKEAYLRPGVAGRRIGAWAFAEPDAGSDPAGMKTRAVRDGNSFSINGSKILITNGDIADFLVVTTVTSPGQGLRGLSLIIVDRDSPGFSARRLPTLGMRAAHTAELSFQECRVPADHLLGEEDTGFSNAMRTLTEGRVIAAAFALGLGRAAFDRSLEFAKQRVAFGQPIGKFQGIQWLLSDMATRLEAARLLTYQAAWRADQGLPYITESSMAKLFASETATEVAKTAVLIHGGAGFMMEHDIQRFYRDCMVLEIGEGTSHIQRNTIAHQLGL